jgi:glutathione S-transferase
LFGDCDIEGADIDSIYEGLLDAGTAWREADKGTDEEKAAKKHTFFSDTLPKWLGFFNGFFKPGATTLVGSRLSLADIALFHFLDRLGANLPPGALQAFPHINALRQHVHDHLAHYINHRPDAPF